MKIDHTNIGQAVDLLVKGFPTRTQAFWEAGLARMLASPAHASGEHPIGFLLEADGKPAGVGLTAVAPGSCAAHPGSHDKRRINLASWYVDEAHRWRMPILLRRMMADKSAVYTDLTPTRDVQPLLTSLGFEPLNGGVTVVNLAAAAVMPGAGYTLSDVTTSGVGGLPEHEATLIRDHLEYGCIALRLSKDGLDNLLLLKPSYAKRVPVLQIIYCNDNEVVRNAIPNIARFLIKRCHFGLVLENPPEQVPGRTFVNVVMPTKRKRFVKNSKPGPGTDFTYSELVFFDF